MTSGDPVWRETSWQPTEGKPATRRIVGFWSPCTASSRLPGVLVSALPLTSFSALEKMLKGPGLRFPP